MYILLLFRRPPVQYDYYDYYYDEYYEDYYGDYEEIR